MRILRLKAYYIYLLTFLYIPSSLADDSFKKIIRENRSVIITTINETRIRITPYGNSMFRIQAIRKGEDFFPDNYYEMVLNHNWPGKLQFQEREDSIFIFNNAKELQIRLSKQSLALSFFSDNKNLLAEKEGIQWNGNIISESFIPDNDEHFTGLGHGFFGRADKIDLAGEEISRNYGTVHGDQAPLIVPFYLSSKGYGIFLNSTFTNKFIFNKNGNYSFSIDDRGSEGRMDYFFIYGPAFKTIIDLYTQLTGRPRFPLLSFFGLGLSDKANDHTSSDPSDENWWKKKVTEHRNAGLPLDHLINDNRWRAGGGQRCESYFEWDKTRFPDPTEYQLWLKKNGLITTIDLNRCISEKSYGWSSSFNMPGTNKVEFGGSTPDFTRKEVRDWFWNLFWSKSLNPKLHYPGDALWIDEFDEYSPIEDTVKLGNGRIWGEMKNYWYFLIAKTLADGWDKSFKGSKRSFFWIRGMTAGAQRYGTLWTGDIKPIYEDMKKQIVSMQLAGLSGFPFEGHDQGGFNNWETNKGPDPNMYRKWSMAMGSFNPFWKPHGVKESRWPMDRTPKEMETAKLFAKLRYQLMPYIYSAANQSSVSGLPMARAMVIDYQANVNAWKYDLQYMWGNDFLVVPNPSENDSVNLWLPEGTWYDYWTNTKITGDKIIDYPSPAGNLVLFVRAGSIIPMADYALSTAFIDKSKLTLTIYPGKDGEFNLYEDDGVSEKYKKGEKRNTLFVYDDKENSLTIHKAEGTFTGAPAKKDYEINFIGISNVKDLLVNGKKLKTVDAESNQELIGYYEKDNSIFVKLKNIPVNKDIRIVISR